MNKKELIRRYALETIAQYGFHNTKVQMIADRANISVGTIYNYFKSKEEILNYIFEVEYSKVINLMDKINQSSESELNKIRSLLETQFQHLMDNPDIVKILIQDGLQHSEYSSNIKRMSYSLIKQFSQFIGEGKKKGEVKEVNPELFAFVMLQGITSVVDFIQQYGIVENDNETKNQLISYMIDGIKNN